MSDLQQLVLTYFRGVDEQKIDMILAPSPRTACFRSRRMG